MTRGESLVGGSYEPDDIADYALYTLIMFVYVFLPEVWTEDENREIESYTQRSFSEELQQN